MTFVAKFLWKRNSSCLPQKAGFHGFCAQFTGTEAACSTYIWP